MMVEGLYETMENADGEVLPKAGVIRTDPVGFAEPVVITRSREALPGMTYGNVSLVVPLTVTVAAAPDGNRNCTEPSIRRSVELIRITLVPKPAPFAHWGIVM